LQKLTHVPLAIAILLVYEQLESTHGDQTSANSGNVEKFHISRFWKIEKSHPIGVGKI